MPNTSPIASTESTGSTAASDVAQLRVSYGSDVLGRGIFWEGSPDRIGEIHNHVARTLAGLALQARRPQCNGMWIVTPVDANGQDMGTPVDKLAAFLRANARSVRPGRAIPSPYAAFPLRAGEAADHTSPTDGVLSGTKTTS